MYQIEIIHPVTGLGGGAEILRERSRSTVERGKSAMERRKRVEMRLLQWLPLPSIFVLSSVMRRLYREGAKARQKKEGVHEEENRHGGERRSRVFVYAYDVDTLYIHINVSLYEFVHPIHSRIYNWSRKPTRLRYVHFMKNYKFRSDY